MSTEKVVIDMRDDADSNLPDLKYRVKGYPTLAEHMGHMPQLGIFRRFGALNARNLLYLQAELTFLEEMLILAEKRDNDHSDIREDFGGNWYDLSNSGAGNEEMRRQWELVLRIREKLKEYNEALLQQRVIASMEEPSPYDVDYLQRYLQTEDMGPNALSGRDRFIWGTFEKPLEKAPDLVTIRPANQEDSFSKWFTNKGIEKFFETRWSTRKPALGSNVPMYKTSSLLKITRWITSVLASMLPIVAITVLFLVESPPARLGIIAAFNLFLSVLLVGFTKATRAEVFSVCAAFAAVQVVFVGSALKGANDGNNGGDGSHNITTT